MLFESSFKDRIKEERKRLGLSQAEFGLLGGVQQQAQYKYESGKRSPNINYLMLISLNGVDVNYLITGERVVKNETYIKNKSFIDAINLLTEKELYIIKNTISLLINARNI